MKWERIGGNSEIEHNFNSNGNEKTEEGRLYIDLILQRWVRSVSFRNVIRTPVTQQVID